MIARLVGCLHLTLHFWNLPFVVHSVLSISTVFRTSSRHTPVLPFLWKKYGINSLCMVFWTLKPSSPILLLGLVTLLPILWFVFKMFLICSDSRLHITVLILPTHTVGPLSTSVIDKALTVLVRYTKSIFKDAINPKFRYGDYKFTRMLRACWKCDFGSNTFLHFETFHNITAFILLLFPGTLLLQGIGGGRGEKCWKPFGSCSWWYNSNWWGILHLPHSERIDFEISAFDTAFWWCRRHSNAYTRPLPDDSTTIRIPDFNENTWTTLSNVQNGTTKALHQTSVP